jgi:hypothetical protein
VNSRQREQSFLTLDEAQTFQLTLTAGKRVQGAMFTDPRAGMTRFLPLAEVFIGQMARASANSKATYRSNSPTPPSRTCCGTGPWSTWPGWTLRSRPLLNVTLGGYSDDYRGTIRRIITGTLDECVRRGILARHNLGGIELAPGS